MMIRNHPLTKKLEWLHDCVLNSLRYQASEGRRTVTLLVQCPRDLGLPRWNGKRLRIVAKDVYLLRCTAWGHTLEADTLDAWRDGVSPETAAELNRHRESGLQVPALTFTLTFHSGSCFELVCEDIQLRVEK